MQSDVLPLLGIVDAQRAFGSAGHCKPKLPHLVAYKGLRSSVHVTASCTCGALHGKYRCKKSCEAQCGDQCSDSCRLYLLISIFGSYLDHGPLAQSNGRLIPEVSQ